MLRKCLRIKCLLILVAALMFLTAGLAYAYDEDEAPDPYDLSFYFIDAIFLERVQYALGGEWRDSDHYPAIHQEDLDVITRLVLNGYGIRSLAGLEFLTNLEYLTVLDNYLTELDVSYNTALEFLNVHGNFMEDPDCVVGWEEIGLELDEDSFYFGTQRDPEEYDLPDYPAPVPEAAPTPLPSPTPAPAPEPFPVPRLAEGHEILYSALPRNYLHDLNARYTTVYLSVYMRYENGEWIVAGAQMVPEPVSEESFITEILTWVLVAMIFVTFIISIWLLVVRIKNS